jgi:hypothetical protein
MYLATKVFEQDIKYLSKIFYWGIRPFLYQRKINKQEKKQRP